MRHTPVILAACMAAAAMAALQARGGAPHGPGSWALFSFAVSAFRGPIR